MDKYFKIARAVTIWNLERLYGPSWQGNYIRRAEETDEQFHARLEAQINVQAEGIVEAVKFVIARYVESI